MAIKLGGISATGRGGGFGFIFGTGTSIFADDTARDTYFTNNPGQLTQYTNNQFLLIQVGTGFQRRVNNAWEDVTNIVRGAQGIKGDKGDENRHFVTPANVSQSLAEITLTIAGVTSYQTGMQVEFFYASNASPENLRIKINSLDAKKLLKADRAEFALLEVPRNTKIVATYDGTDFITQFIEHPQFHYVPTDGVSVSNNVYEIEDTDIVGFGISPPSMIGFDAKETNTGPIKLIVNGSSQVDVTLSDGTQIPSGMLKNGQFILLAFESGIGWKAITIPPARSLKGNLLAVGTIAEGTHPDSTPFTWAAESGVTNISVEDAPAGVWKNYLDVNNAETEDALVRVPALRGASATQIGWYFEIFNGTTKVFEKFTLFSGYSTELIDVATGITFALTYQAPNIPGSPINYPVVYVRTYGASDPPQTVIPSGAEYKINMYISEN